MVGYGGGNRASYNYHEPPKPTFLEVFMVNNLVFRWPKPFFFMVLGAHGIDMYRLFGGIPSAGKVARKFLPESWGPTLQLVGGFNEPI